MLSPLSLRPTAGVISSFEGTVYTAGLKALEVELKVLSFPLDEFGAARGGMCLLTGNVSPLDSPGRSSTVSLLRDRSRDRVTEMESMLDCRDREGISGVESEIICRVTALKVLGGWSCRQCVRGKKINGQICIQI